ncbi:hypothetical protein ACJZ2D_012129 [Fusarium nematophilum]
MAAISAQDTSTPLIQHANCLPTTTQLPSPSFEGPAKKPVDSFPSPNDTFIRITIPRHHLPHQSNHELPALLHKLPKLLSLPQLLDAARRKHADHPPQLLAARKQLPSRVPIHKVHQVDHVRDPGLVHPVIPQQLPQLHRRQPLQLLDAVAFGKQIHLGV